MSLFEFGFQVICKYICINDVQHFFGIVQFIELVYEHWTVLLPEYMRQIHAVDGKDSQIHQNWAIERNYYTCHVPNNILFDNRQYDASNSSLSAGHEHLNI